VTRTDAIVAARWWSGVADVTMPSDALRRRALRREDPVMSTAMTLGFVLVGLAPVIVAWVAIVMPRGERLASLLALVAGAGAGVVTLAIEARFVSGPTPNSDALFLLASTIGFLVTIVTLALLLRVMRREGNAATASTS
jgi:hypothetical protein